VPVEQKMLTHQRRYFSFLWCYQRRHQV